MLKAITFIILAIHFAGLLCYVKQFAAHNAEGYCILVDIEFYLVADIFFENRTQKEYIILNEDSDQTGSRTFASWNCTTREITFPEQLWEYNFAFKIDDQSKVQMDIIVSYDSGSVEFPAHVFDLGSSEKSWKCDKRLGYKCEKLHDGLIYSVSYNITEIRVQAYNVEGRSYSESVQCSKDQTDRALTCLNDPTTKTGSANSLAAHAMVLFFAMLLLFVSVNTMC